MVRRPVVDNLLWHLFKVQSKQKDADTRDRTRDLQIFSLTLSQLSYRGEGSHFTEKIYRSLVDTYRKTPASFHALYLSKNELVRSRRAPACNLNEVHMSAGDASGICLLLMC